MSGHTQRRAFTLIEILIVVVILGILVGAVVPQFSSAGQDAAMTTFIANIRGFSVGAERYRSATRQFPEGSASGVMPAGLDAYVDVHPWVGGTPIGGLWDSERNSSGVTSAIGVHFQGDNPGDAYMTLIDARFDDGDLTTGAFRKLAADRYYLVLVN
jgi:prepilin-type N-terminal cleavage/methylation domain-containing protein